MAKHPAPFSDSIITALQEWIPRMIPPIYTVHDPFAGEGVRLGRLCDQLGYRFSGADLEEWPNSDPRVRVGDSTDYRTYPHGQFAVVTSPTYNNGVNDHFLPKETSRRLTYRVALGRALHENNTGRYSGRGSRKGEERYWEITHQVVKHWPDICLVNVKDSYRNRAIYPLVDLWTDLLQAHGYKVSSVEVGTPSWRYGANHEARALGESILIGRRYG